MAGGARFLGFRERLEEKTFHPTRERISEAGKLEEIRRSREEKSSGSPVRIHHTLDGEEQFGDPLHLIEGDLGGQLRDEARRV